MQQVKDSSIKALCINKNKKRPNVMQLICNQSHNIRTSARRYGEAKPTTEHSWAARQQLTTVDTQLMRTPRTQTESANKRNNYLKENAGVQSHRTMNLHWHNKSTQRKKNFAVRTLQGSTVQSPRKTKEPAREVHKHRAMQSELYPIARWNESEE